MAGERITHSLKHPLGWRGLFSRGRHLNGFDLRKAELTDKNFKGTDFTDAELDNASFESSNLESAHFPSITIGKEKIDITPHELSIRNEQKIWNAHSVPRKLWVGTCEDCELFNKEILVRSHPGADAQAGKYSRRGVVLFQNDHPLGYIKLKGSKSFLPMRTVRDEKGRAIFWKGMIYALDRSLVTYLNIASQERDIPEERQWRRADMEAIVNRGLVTKPMKGFDRNNLRFLMQPELYDALTSLTEDIESGKEPMIDILP